ncbi:uncharacterized protein EV422DRAFT_534935 [Fimicolochytrium jonesii]|uniref:uncharacterized protein n=1 Tax=Fimicolochytrium jonesii TaxID=1396493 RepID=UPI0022FF30D2|nr:uncharacterized protein EV422DRAFT_534935 [Fimicolochytrium jonesii]KAI8819493.1 hypothetical protein EV422DRAFT_534935 [Fimicolochytrium jonesii]
MVSTLPVVKSIICLLCTLYFTYGFSRIRVERSTSTYIVVVQQIWAMNTVYASRGPYIQLHRTPQKHLAETCYVKLTRIRPPAISHWTYCRSRA